MAINITVQTVGIEGPPGPSTDTSNFYQSSNEQRLQFLIPTGIEYLYVNYSGFSNIPLLFTDTQTSMNIDYNCSVRYITNTGCYIYFSDIIAETGVYLNILLKQL